MAPDVETVIAIPAQGGSASEASVFFSQARVHVPGGAPVHVKGAPVQVGGTSHVEVAQGNHLYVHNARNTVCFILFSNMHRGP